MLRGLAGCIKHRGEEERSSRYDDLIAAEKRAVISKKGLTNPLKEPPTHHVNDIAGNAGKAKQVRPDGAFPNPPRTVSAAPLCVHY